MSFAPRLVLYALLTTTLSAVAALAQPSIEIRYFGGHPDDMGKKASDGTWRQTPHASQATEAREVSAVVQQAVLDPRLKVHLDDAFELLERFHSYGLENRFPMNEDGRLVFVIDSSGVGGAACGTRVEQSGGGDLSPSPDPKRGSVRVFLRVGTSDLAKVLRMAPRSEWASEMAQVLVHEMAHARHRFAVSAAIADWKQYFLDPRSRATLTKMSAPPGAGGAHSFTSIKDPGFAFTEGFAQAEVLFRFKEHARNRQYYTSDFFTPGGKWFEFLSRIPNPEIRTVLFGTVVSSYQPGTVHAVMWDEIAREAGFAGDPRSLLTQPDHGRTDVPTFQQITSCEGIVACILTDLYEHGITSPAEVTELMRKKPPQDLNELLGLIKLRYQTADPSRIARLEQIVDRRTLGLYTKGPKVAAAWADFLARKLDPAMFAKVIEAHVGAAPDKPDQHVVFVAERPKDGTVSHAVEGTPGKRNRALQGGGGHAKALAANGTMMLAALGTNLAMGALTGQVNIGDVLQDTVQQLESPTYWGSMLGQEGVERLTGKGLVGAAKLGKNWNSAAFRLQRAVLRNAHFGGFVANLAAEFLIRQVMSHSYIWSCSVSVAERMAVWAWCAITDYSKWTRDDTLAVALGSAGAGLGIVLAGLIAFPPSWPAVAVVAITAVIVGIVAWIGTFLAGLIANYLDKREYNSLRDDLKAVLLAYESTEPSTGPPASKAACFTSEETLRLETPSSVDGKRQLLAKGLGEMEMKQEKLCGCDPRGATPPPERTLTKGLAARLLELRNKVMAKVLEKIKDVTGKQQTEYAEARDELDRATNPMHDSGADIPKLALYFACDLEGNLIPHKEIADYLVNACVADATFNKAVANLPEEPTEQDLDALHGRILGEVTAALSSLPEKELVRRHFELMLRQKQRARKARDRFIEFSKEFAKQAGEVSKKNLEELAGMIEEETRDLEPLLTGSLGETFKKANAEAFDVMVARRENMAKVGPAYRRIAQALVELAQKPPADL